MQKLLAKMLIRVPRRLPVGLTEFNNFADRVIMLAGQFADTDSMRFAIATAVIHADASKGRVADKFFVDRLVKSAANQVASYVFQEVKQKQAEMLQAAELKAAQDKQDAEAAAIETAATDVIN